MLSLPLIAPQNEYTLFLSPQLRPSTSNPSDPQTHNQYRRPTSHNASSSNAPSSSRTSLAQLLADEQAITQRKHNIRRFGAGWIKPPGVTKTLQAETEERAEREEQELLARREQAMLDMQAQQEAEETRQRAAAAASAAAEEEEEAEEEVDLDEEIPDAEEEEEEEVAYSDTEEEEEEEEEEEDVTFNEESLLENSFLPNDEERDRVQQERYARLEEAELTGIAQDEADLGIERDLDDSVPEAGSYEHTDSEMVDSESEEEGSEEEGESVGRRQSAGRRSVRSSLVQSRRSLLGREASGRSARSRDVSSLLESSFMSSSPVLGRLRSANHRQSGGR